MNLLITGSTGYIGRNLIYEINKNRYKIGILVRDIDKAKNLFGHLDNIYYINLKKNTYKDEIKFFNPEITIHLAAYSTSNNDYKSLKKLINSNISFASDLLDSLKETNIKLFLNTGTFAEYYYNDGQLNSAYLYAATKTAFRSLLYYYKQLIEFKVINIIPYSVYGGNDTRKKVIHYIFDSLNSKETIDMTGGKQILDFIHIDDIVDFYIKTLNKHQQFFNWNSDVLEFHLGTGKGTSIKKLADKIEKITGQKTNINWGGRPYRKRDIMYSVAPIAKNIEILDWRSEITLSEGLKKML